MKLFDTITYDCGRVLNGIIDYTTPHHHIFYEYNKPTKQIIELVILWRAHLPHIRWSVFLDICNVKFDYPILLSKNSVIGRAYDPKVLDKNVTRISRKHPLHESY